LRCPRKGGASLISAHNFDRTGAEAARTWRERRAEMGIEKRGRRPFSDVLLSGSGKREDIKRGKSSTTD